MNIYPDVLFKRGKKLWERAMGLEGCAFLLRFLKTQLKLNSELYMDNSVVKDNGTTDVEQNPISDSNETS